MYNKCFTYNVTAFYCVTSLSFSAVSFHESMPLIDRPFTNGTLVGENVSSRIKTRTRRAITPSRIVIFSPHASIDKCEMSKQSRRSNKLLKRKLEHEVFGY